MVQLTIVEATSITVGEFGNGYFDSSYADWISGKANEKVFAYYKNFWFSEITNITTLSDDMGNIICEWGIKGFAGLSEPWPEEEVLVPIKYTFHCFPLNGSLKTDFSIENFAANAASRLFIEFSMRYTSMKYENVKLVMNGEKLDINLINDHCKIDSTTILLVVNGDVKGFFDFSGRCEIDNSTTTPIGVTVPWVERRYHVFPPIYSYSTNVGIQLSYSHVKENLTHDPSFGLKTSNEITPPQTPPKPNVELSWKAPHSWNNSVRSNNNNDYYFEAQKKIPLMNKYQVHQHPAKEGIRTLRYFRIIFCTIKQNKAQHLGIRKPRVQALTANISAGSGI
jgi:hypothetical protein